MITKDKLVERAMNGLAALDDAKTPAEARDYAIAAAVMIVCSQEAPQGEQITISRGVLERWQKDLKFALETLKAFSDDRAPNAEARAWWGIKENVSDELQDILDGR